MTSETFKKAKELDLRIGLLKKAINNLKRDSGTRVAINNIRSSDVKLDHIRDENDGHFLVSGSNSFFLKQKNDTITFLTGALEALEAEFTQL